MKRNGFTLVELMVTVAILGILAAVAAPGFNDFISRNSVASETNKLVSLLRFARSEAVQRHTDVRVCPSNATQSACGAGNNGFLVIETSSAAVLQATPPFSGALVINNANVTFSEDGSTRTPGVITVTDGNNNAANVTLNGAGLIQH